MELKRIAHIHTNFPEKFGIPRQSGLVETPGQIIFEPTYNNPDGVRGLEEFSLILKISVKIPFSFTFQKDIKL